MANKTVQRLSVSVKTNIELTDEEIAKRKHQLREYAKVLFSASESNVYAQHEEAQVWKPEEEIDTLPIGTNVLLKSEVQYNGEEEKVIQYLTSSISQYGLTEEHIPDEASVEIIGYLPIPE